MCRLPPVTLPAPALWQWLLKDTCLIAVVSYAVSISLARLFAAKYNYDIDASQARRHAHAIPVLLSSSSSSVNVHMLVPLCRS